MKFILTLGAGIFLGYSVHKKLDEYASLAEDIVKSVIGVDSDGKAFIRMSFPDSVFGVDSEDNMFVRTSPSDSAK